MLGSCFKQQTKKRGKGGILASQEKKEKNHPTKTTVVMVAQQWF